MEIKFWIWCWYAGMIFWTELFYLYFKNWERDPVFKTKEFFFVTWVAILLWPIAVPLAIMKGMKR